MNSNERTNGRQHVCRVSTRLFLRSCGLASMLLSALCGLSGCATFQHGEPDWVRNPKTTYPENRFLVAVGEGDTRQAAENAAAANLARIFESHIESDERLVDSVVETEENITRTTDLTTDINILSSQTLLNVQHAEAWKDHMGRFHAVAYLNRRDTASIYREEIEELNRQVESLLAKVEQTVEPLKQYALLRTALKTARENDVLLRQLKVIHSASASASAPSYSLLHVRQATIESAKSIRVSIHLEGDPDGRMADSIREFITRYGFVVGKPAALTLTGRVMVEDTGKRTAGLAFFRYHLALQISNTQGTVLTAINDKGREAVTNTNEAPERCHRTMENALNLKGRLGLDAYFDALAHSN